MPLENIGASFNQDSRGVSAVIGFLLVFGFIIILLSINQAQFVPQENSQIEFQHYQDIQDDMVEVRSSISTAGQANVSQYPTVELGTSYPTRLFALNPPAPAGTLQTSDKYDITLQNASNSATVETQFLLYRPGYNELNENPIWYENSVLYIDARDNSGGVAVLEDQNLIRGGSQVRINAIQNDFSVTSAGRVTIEIYPTDNSDVNLDDWTGDVTVNIPTRLTGPEYWDDELGGTGVYNGVTEDGVESGIHLLSITVDANSLKFNTVGINKAPTGQGSASRGVGPIPAEGTDADTGGGNALVFNNDAVATDGPDSDGVPGGVEFTVTNQFGQNAEIETVEVTNPSGPEKRINDQASPNDEPRKTEIYVSGNVNDGWVDVNGGTNLPNTFDMDADGFNQDGNPETGSDGSFTFYFYEFENNGGNRINMSGESFNVTISYLLADGTTGTESFTVNVA
jgi:hypothetical protein